MDAARGIGLANRLPWHLAEDLAHFKRHTTGHPIIMGRKTFESIGRPLPKRRNIIISANPAWQADGVETVKSLAEAQQKIGEEHGFIIGGAQIYTQALPLVQDLLVTEIAQRFECDTFFPVIDPELWQESERQNQQTAEFAYAFVRYRRR